MAKKDSIPTFANPLHTRCLWLRACYREGNRYTNANIHSNSDAHSRANNANCTQC